MRNNEQLILNFYEAKSHLTQVKQFWLQQMLVPKVNSGRIDNIPTFQ